MAVKHLRGALGGKTYDEFFRGRRRYVISYDASSSLRRKDGSVSHGFGGPELFEC